MSNEELEEIQDMLSYLDLHLGAYEWGVLTTDQKELLADLIDAAREREAAREGYPEAYKINRWWRDE